MQIVELPYDKSDRALLVALPPSTTPIDGVLAGLSGGVIDAWSKGLAKTKVVPSLPRFEWRVGSVDQAGARGDGVRTAFRVAADFSGITKPSRPQDRLSVSDVFHRAFIQVDETGTTAAAATGVDRPFLFFVRSRKTGQVLFAGRVLDPAAQKP